MKLSKKIGAIAGISAVIAGVIYWAGQTEDKQINQLKRPSYNSSSDTYPLTVRTEDGEYEVEVVVEPLKIPDEELQKYFDLSYEIICTEMVGNNSSFEYVQSDLNFITEVEEYGISVDYTTDNYELVNCFGEVNNAKALSEGSICTVNMTLEYDGKYQSYCQKVVIYPPDYTEEEQFVNAITEEIAMKNSEAVDEYLNLPKAIDGKSISFVQREDSKLPILVIFSIIIILLWYYKKFVVKKNLEKERELKLQLDYSEIVSKLSLLMGAGMSGASAFTKISYDYQNALKNNKKIKRPAYDEIMVASNRIASGVSESEVYALFGRSCRIHCYVKLGSLLTQNVRKGGEDFIEMLKAETTEAFIERKAMARKTGEEAGTKLLLPMGMMLCIVLVVIIVPAFMSF